MLANAGRRLSCLVAAVHLSLVTCGAFNFAPWIGVKWIEGPVSTYTDLSGARYSYGFFAPNIPNQAVAIATSIDSSGNRTIRTFGTGTTELDHRIATMISFFTSVETDTLNAASIAKYVLDRNPGAQRVEVSLRCYNIPTMKQYRHGVQATADEYYRGVFARSSDVIHD